SMPGGSAAPMENSPPGTQTMPSGASTGGRCLFSTVGAKPGGSEAAETFQLTTKPGPQSVHSAMAAVRAITTEIQTPVQAKVGLPAVGVPFESPFPRSRPGAGLHESARARLVDCLPGSFRRE